MTAVLTLLASPVARWVGLALAVVAVVAWLRMDAASDAVKDVAVQAAQQEQETRHEADEAGRAAGRDGGAKRMRDGSF